MIVALSVLETSLSRVLDRISEFQLRRLVADVESFFASGCDVAITLTAISILTVLRFFLTSKSICDAVSGAIALILVAKDASGPRDFETVEIFAKSCSTKELFYFCERRFFAFFPVFA